MTETLWIQNIHVIAAMASITVTLQGRVSQSPLHRLLRIVVWIALKFRASVHLSDSIRV